MRVDRAPSTAVIGADRVAGPMKMLSFNGPIAVCLATTAYGAAILPAACCKDRNRPALHELGA